MACLYCYKDDMPADLVFCGPECEAAFFQRFRDVDEAFDFLERLHVDIPLFPGEDFHYA